MAQIEKCIICSKDVNEKLKPFCSIRCKDIDLGKWFNEGYRIPTEEKLSIVKPDQVEIDKA